MTFLDHTQLHTHTHTHTAGIVWTTDQLATKIASSQCKQAQQMNVHGLSWIRNRDPSPRVAADLHLRSHSHRYRREVVIGVKIYQGCFHQCSKRKISATELGVKCNLSGFRGGCCSNVSPLHHDTVPDKDTIPRFLGAFDKLRKATISFVMYVCLSVCLSVRLPVRPSGTVLFPLGEFS